MTPDPASAPRRNPLGGVNKYGFELSDEQIADGVHRRKVGPGWYRAGRRQLEFLIGEGLSPQSLLLDVGCGAMRGGIPIARYLEPGNYYGVDVNASLIRAALIEELPREGLAERVNPDNLRVTDRFECDFGVKLDFAIAQSVFTHLPLNHIRMCLYQLAKVMAPGGRFYASFFEAPPHTEYDAGIPHPRHASFSDRDPYHYRWTDLVWAAESVAGWEATYVGDWGHPGGQRMARFTLPGAPGARARLAAKVHRTRRRLGTRLVRV